MNSTSNSNINVYHENENTNVNTNIHTNVHMNDNININDKPQDECGIVGFYSTNSEQSLQKHISFSLFSLQHRGQESSGISYVDSTGDIITKKAMGKVSRLIKEHESLATETANSAISHVRYSTAGHSSIKNAMPFTYRDENKQKKNNFSVAHNGNIVNFKELSELLNFNADTSQDNTEEIYVSDSQVILNIIASKIHKGIITAIRETMSLIKGSYALVILTQDQLIAVRDPNGIKPLCLGLAKDGTYVVASESCALDMVNAELIRDVQAGEILTIDKKGLTSSYFLEDTIGSPCSFEYIYFARPDSIMNKINVYQSRFNAGQQLAIQDKTKHKDLEIDYVIGVPDSGIASALGYAKQSGIPYIEGFVKSKYIGRSFINPNKDDRKDIIRAKLNPIIHNIKDKNLIMLDDSLVRGTTSKLIIELLREAGAKEIHFRLASPAVKHPCYFGMDIKSREELIASNKSLAEINAHINSDTLEYLDLDGLALSLCAEKKSEFCSGCFSGIYPIQSPINNNL